MNVLPFLDILIINNKNKLELKIHFKSTFQNDHKRFYSHYTIKKGIIIGF